MAIAQISWVLCASFRLPVTFPIDIFMQLGLIKGVQFNTDSLTHKTGYLYANVVAKPHIN